MQSTIETQQTQPQVEPAPVVQPAPVAPTPQPVPGLLNRVIANTVDVKCSDGGALAPRTLEEIIRVAKFIVASGLQPKSYKNSDCVAVAIAAGAELGLSPMQALQVLAVVNGNVAAYGDGLLALAMPALESFAEWFEDDQGKIDMTAPGWAARMEKARREKKLVAIFEGQRKGSTTKVRESFSMIDAELSKLLGKQGPWTEYPQRMLRWRARSWGIRALAPDRLKGMQTVEELIDAVDINQLVATTERASVTAKLAEMAKNVNTEQPQAEVA